MIEETLLDEWARDPKRMTTEQIQMVISQLKQLQHNSIVIYVFPQTYLDVANNSIGTPNDTAITREKFVGFVTEAAVNGDWFVSRGTRPMPQDAPVAQPPVITPAPRKALYQAVVVTDHLNVRDGEGYAHYGQKVRGDLVEVWEVRDSIAGNDNRAVITAPSVVPELNIWNEFLEKVA